MLLAQQQIYILSTGRRLEIACPITLVINNNHGTHLSSCLLYPFILFLLLLLLPVPSQSTFLLYATRNCQRYKHRCVTTTARSATDRRVGEPEIDEIVAA